MKRTPVYMISLVYLLIYCGPAQPDVSLRVSPERVQFFQYKTISMDCEEDGKPVLGWTVMRNTSKRAKAACKTDWGTTEGASCTLKIPYQHDRGVYWCQSTSGEVSPSINIMISDGDVILESPVHPVPEGSDVTLRCLYTDQTTDQPSSNLPADFYRNGSLFRAVSTGQMTILHVSKSDEGFYKCNISGLGQSLESWVETNPSPTSDPTSEPAEPLITWKQVIIKLLVFTPYFVSTLLYFSILRDRARARAAAIARRRDINDVIMEVAV